MLSFFFKYYIWYIIWTPQYADVIMSTMASQITGVSKCLLNRLFGRLSKKYQNSTSLPFVRGIHRRQVDSPHEGPVTRRMFPFDNVIIRYHRRPPQWRSTITGTVIEKLLYKETFCTKKLCGRCIWKIMISRTVSTRDLYITQPFFCKLYLIAPKKLPIKTPLFCDSAS